MAPRFQPTCETDESSDEGYTEPKSQPQSNVSAKRASQNELHRTHGAARPTDLTSDSGYSSRTAATGSSADSAPSSNNRRRSPVKQEAPPAVPEAPAPASTHARPRLSESSRKKSTQARETPKPSKTSKTHKEKKPVVVRQSSTRNRAPSISRPRRDSVGSDCDDPNCDQCLARLKRKPPPLKTGMDDNYSSYISRSPRVPPSPSRPPIGYHHPLVETQIAGSTRSQVYSHPRPHSYYGGSSLSDRHNYSQMNTPHGPPPAMWNPQYAAMMGAASQAGYFSGVPHSPLSASYEARPGMPSRVSDGYPPRAPLQNLPNPRYGPAVAPALYQQAPIDDHSDEDEDEDGYYRHTPTERSRMIMAPPPRPTAVEPPPRRPSLRSQTTNNVLRARPLSVNYHDRAADYEEDLVEMTQSLQLPGRRSSVAGSDRNHYYPSVSRGDRVMIQPSRSDRPRDSERERTRRNTMYNRDVVHTDFDDALRRDATADDRRKNKLHTDVNKVEAYLNSMNGSSGAGAGVDNLRTNTRGRASSNATRPRGSSHSQHSYDGASRISDGSRSTSTRKAVKDGNMVIRMEGDDMFVEGDMGRKVFRVTTGEDGNQQIIISETKGREKQYLTEGSRVTTNTSSSRSRSDRDSALPRGSSRSGYDPAPEFERPMRQQRRVRYADDPRQYYRPERF